MQLVPTRLTAKKTAERQRRPAESEEWQWPRSLHQNRLQDWAALASSRTGRANRPVNVLLDQLHLPNAERGEVPGVRRAASELAPAARPVVS